MVDVSRLSSANMLLGHQIAGLVLHNKDHKSNVCPPKNWMMFEQFANAGKNMFMQKCLSIPCQNIAKHSLANRIISNNNDSPLSSIFSTCLIVCTLHHVPLSAQPNLICHISSSGTCYMPLSVKVVCCCIYSKYSTISSTSTYNIHVSRTQRHDLMY